MHWDAGYLLTHFKKGRKQIMDHNHNAGYGGTSLLVSLAGTVFAFISLNGIDEILRGIAAVVSIAAGFMAIRYYYYVIKEKKESIKNKKSL